MTKQFDSKEAKKLLLAKEEKERELLFEKVIAVLKKELKGFSVEAYLIGSILQPFRFSSHSDIDIVLRNYKGDRFELWVKIEKEIGREVEIIPFETCSFQEFVLKKSFKVI